MKKKETKDNLILSCETHGKEIYFKIKKMEKRMSMKNYVYVWFKKRNQAEKMWVKIVKGNQKSGVGTLDNIPAFLDHLNLGDKVKFRTDDDGITRSVR